MAARGYKVVLNEHSRLWHTIENELNSNGVEIESLSEAELTELKTFYWQLNEDRSDLFTVYVDPRAHRTMQARTYPVSLSQPSILIIPGGLSALKLQNAIFVDTEAIAKYKIGILLSKKTGKQSLDDLPQTLEGLEELKQEIKDRQTANHGKLTKEDKALKEKIKTQEKAIGERNKQKRNNE